MTVVLGSRPTHSKNKVLGFPQEYLGVGRFIEVDVQTNLQMDMTEGVLLTHVVFTFKSAPTTWIEISDKSTCSPEG